MKTEEEITTRRYIITAKELKQKLGLKGDIDKIGLWAGGSPQQKARDDIVNSDEWFIETKESQSQGKKKEDI